MGRIMRCVWGVSCIVCGVYHVLCMGCIMYCVWGVSCTVCGMYHVLCMGCIMYCVWGVSCTVYGVYHVLCMGVSCTVYEMLGVYSHPRFTVYWIVGQQSSIFFPLVTTYSEGKVGGWTICHFSIIQVHFVFVNSISFFFFLFLIEHYMFIISAFWLGCDRPSQLLYIMPALLLSILTPLFLLSSSVSLSYFVLAVPMRECLGKHSCMSSLCPIAILNGTFLFSLGEIVSLVRSFVYQNQIKLN